MKKIISIALSILLVFGVFSIVSAVAAGTANYTVNHYKQNWDGTYPATPTDVVIDSAEIGTQVTAKTKPTTQGKDYVCFTAPEKQTITILEDGSATVDYYYTRNTNTLVWDLDGGYITSAEGTYTPAGVYRWGTPVVMPEVAKDGCTFNGWSGEITSIKKGTNQTTTVTAYWLANTYKVTLDNQGATTSDIDEFYYKFGTAGYYKDSGLKKGFTTGISIPTKTDYSFVGYFTEQYGQGTKYIDADGLINSEILNVADNTTLYAYWVGSEYTITWNANGGLINGESTKIENKNAGMIIVAPTAVKDGSSFAGWTPEVATVMPESNVEYTAVWKSDENKNTVDLALKGNISIGFNIDIESYITDVDNAVMKVTYDHSKNYSQDIRADEYSIAQMIKSTDNTYRFEVALAPTLIAQPVTLQLFDNGSPIATITENYSIKKYCETIIATPENETITTELKALCSSILNFGIYSQSLFNYTPSVIGEKDTTFGGMTPQQLTALTDDTYKPIISGEIDNFKFSEMTFMALEDSAIRFYVNLDKSALDQLTITLIEIPETSKMGIRTGVNSSSGNSYIEIYGIASKYLNDNFAFSVSDNTNQITVTASAISYARSCVNNSTDTKTVDFAKALYQYSLAADAYFN